MSGDRSNTAYNLDLFDDSYKKQSKENIYKLVSKKKAKRSKTSAVLTITFLLAIAVVVTVQITSFTQLNELEKELSGLRKDYTELKAEENRLNVLLDKKVDLEEIETIAVNQYGMHQTDKSSIAYVSLRGEDYTKVVGDKGFFTGLKNVFINTFKSLNVMTEYLK